MMFSLSLVRFHFDEREMGELKETISTISGIGASPTEIERYVNELLNRINGNNRKTLKVEVKPSGIRKLNSEVFTYFPDRYLLDNYEEPLYFETIEEAAECVSSIVGHKVDPTVKTIDEALEDYLEEHEDEDVFYSFHEFKVVQD